MDKPEQAGRILAIVPHSGGQRFLLERKSFTEDIATFLCSLRFREEGSTSDIGLKVFTPVAAHGLDRAKKFSPPWTYLLEIPQGDTLLRQFLLWQEVFVIHTTLLFSVHDLREPSPLWTVLVLTGTPGAVADNPDAIKEILADIKSAAWADGQFCNFVVDCVEKNWGHTGDYASCVKAATDTLDLTLSRGKSHRSEQLIGCYVLLAKPISPDREELKTFSKFLAVPGVYWRGPYALEVNKVKVECKMCRDVTHCLDDCPLPSTPSWQGTPPPTTLGGAGVATSTVSAPTLAEQGRRP
ncbi:hypothetical protein DICSQDRAFT_175364 [Dichomitus squalens LYAD-421 SS1]|uniref:Uncharacterized protein n=1 Tax=Dichomitus squalens (strain LYAD-421) TaxID=732165 RepID=R7SJM2_DICSQ|nr:uncharacterized protein DICSQDRAFT_175364 [Dichomitus squalens LYAD-421 SS1]EJF55930.1 hypothetical protein DICSQDRAFT_175364 [Dichomitus squalens LYAD-421 SS1]